MTNSATNDAAHTDDAAAIRSLREAWVTAVGRGDTGALPELLAQDYEVWTHGAPPLRGPKAAAAAMAGALARFHIEQRFEPLETVVAGDWAFERGVERMRLTPRDGGEPQHFEQRAFLIMRRGADGRWRYARGMTNGLPALPPPSDEHAGTDAARAAGERADAADAADATRTRR